MLNFNLNFCSKRTSITNFNLSFNHFEDFNQQFQLQFRIQSALFANITSTKSTQGLTSNLTSTLVVNELQSQFSTSLWVFNHHFQLQFPYAISCNSYNLTCLQLSCTCFRFQLCRFQCNSFNFPFNLRWQSRRAYCTECFIHVTARLSPSVPSLPLFFGVGQSCDLPRHPFPLAQLHVAPTQRTTTMCKLPTQQQQHSSRDGDN